MEYITYNIDKKNNIMKLLVENLLHRKFKPTNQDLEEALIVS